MLATEIRIIRPCSCALPRLHLLPTSFVLSIKWGNSDSPSLLLYCIRSTLDILPETHRSRDARSCPSSTRARPWFYQAVKVEQVPGEPSSNVPEGATLPRGRLIFRAQLTIASTASAVRTIQYSVCVHLESARHSVLLPAINSGLPSISPTLLSGHLLNIRYSVTVFLSHRR